jgi:hypothetical protein
VFSDALDGLFGEHEACIDKIMLSTMAIKSISNIAKTRWDVLLAGPAHDERSLKESPSLRLKALLLLVGGLCCADERDKVLRILSLAKYKGDLLPELNYSLSVRDLYIKVVEYWLNSEVDRDLGFLNHSHNTKEKHGLPSWVPDWSVPLSTAVLVSDQKLMDWNKRKSANFQLRAAGSSKVEAKLPLENSYMKPVLQVKGVTLMKIEVIKSRSQFEDFYSILNY